LLIVHFATGRRKAESSTPLKFFAAGGGGGGGLSGRHMKLQTTRGSWRAAYSCMPFLLFAKSAVVATVLK
jgi:hypothetical protein